MKGGGGEGEGEGDDDLEGGVALQRGVAPRAAGDGEEEDEDD